MSKYLIKDTENNRLYQTTLIGKTLEGQEIGEYVVITENNIQYRFLATELEEIQNKQINNIEPIQVKEIQKVKLNKTAIINSINCWDKKDKQYAEVKEVLHIKSMLKTYSNKDDIDYIEYKYNRLVELYYLSMIQEINWRVESMLKDTIDLIINSSIGQKIDSYEMQRIKQVKEYMAV